MLLDELHAKRDTIQILSRRYGARRIRVFGSVARREERADSDVDFLVDFPGGYDLFARRMPLTDQLAQLLKCPHRCRRVLHARPQSQTHECGEPRTGG